MNFNSLPFIVLTIGTLIAYYAPIKATHWQIAVLQADMTGSICVRPGPIKPKTVFTSTDQVHSLRRACCDQDRHVMITIGAPPHTADLAPPRLPTGCEDAYPAPLSRNPNKPTTAIDQRLFHSKCAEFS